LLFGYTSRFMMIYLHQVFAMADRRFDLSTCSLSELPSCMSHREQYDVLHRLLELLPTEYLRKEKNAIPEELIVSIVRTARGIIYSEPHVLRVEPPVIICGDLHGQYYDLLNLYSRRPPHGGDFVRFVEQRRHQLRGTSNALDAPTKRPRSPTKRPRSNSTDGVQSSSDTQDKDPSANTSPSSSSSVHLNKFLFLGDYVDRGSRSIEVMVTLLAQKILYPDKMFLLRGNHEDEQVASLYGFFDECKRRYSLRLFKVFCDLFRCLPVAAVVGDAIFCVHGGISQEVRQLSDIPDVRPSNVPHEGIVSDLLWADPELRLPYHSNGLYSPSPRNVSYIFSPAALDAFLTSCDLDLVVRAHQVVEEGYQFFPPQQRKLITIFGATNYCDEFLNRGAALEVKPDMQCAILTLEPPSEEQRQMLRSLR
jgi:serine/threonine-protein phosphatase PP1 catalytic subunit